VGGTPETPRPRVTPEETPRPARDTQGRLLHLGMWVAKDRRLSCTFCDGEGSNCHQCWGVKTYCSFCRYCGQCGVDHHFGAGGRLLRAALRSAGPTPLCLTHSTQGCDGQTTDCSISRGCFPSKELAKYRFNCTHCPRAYCSQQALDQHSHTRGHSPHHLHPILEEEVLAEGPPGRLGQSIQLNDSQIHPVRAGQTGLTDRPPQALAEGPSGRLGDSVQLNDSQTIHPVWAGQDGLAGRSPQLPRLLENSRCWSISPTPTQVRAVSPVTPPDKPKAVPGTNSLDTCHLPPKALPDPPVTTWHVTNNSRKLLGRFYKSPEQLLFDPPPPQHIPSYKEWREDFIESSGIQAVQCRDIICSVCQGRHPGQGTKGSMYYDCPLLAKVKSKSVELADATCLKCLCLKEYHGLYGDEECYIVSTRSARWNLLCGKPDHATVHHKVCHDCFLETVAQTSQQLTALQRRIDPRWKGGDPLSSPPGSPEPCPRPQGSSQGIPTKAPPHKGSSSQGPLLTKDPHMICQLCTVGKDGAGRRHCLEARCVMRRDGQAPAAYSPPWPSDKGRFK
jgi:hypothetical protein